MGEFRENKDLFIKAIESALAFDLERNHVLAIEYKELEDGQERIVIKYLGGYMSVINANVNSNGANLAEITREIYGEGAHGRIWAGHENTRPKPGIL